MKIVNCALLYADGDKYVWSVVTEGASEYPIDMELVADGSIWENDGTKSVLTDGAWVAESSGGGIVIPEITITFTSDTEGTYTSTVPYQEMVDLISDSPWGNTDGKIYPFCVSLDEELSFHTTNYNENEIVIYTNSGAVFTLNEDGTCTYREFT